MPAVAIALLPPKTAEKESLQTREAIIIPQWDGVSADLLKPFGPLLRTDGARG
jgi:hypothetical protein